MEYASGDDRSSLSDWESVRDDAEAFGASADQKRIVLELPHGGLVVGGRAAGVDAAAINSGGEDSAAPGSTASFAPVTRLDSLDLRSPGEATTAVTAVAARNFDSAGSSVDGPIPSLTPTARSDSASTQSKELPSAASSYRRELSDADDDFTLSSTFEVLSLSPGEIVRLCKRCTFHNKRDSVVSASCDLALVANPDVNADAQIAVNLQQKEERDARSILEESERRQRILQDPLYECACILASNLQALFSGEMLDSFQTLPKDDLEGRALEFIKGVIDLSPKEVSFAFKCIHPTGLEAPTFPTKPPTSAATHEVEVSSSLADALISLETLGMKGGEFLRPIPEDGNNGAEHPDPSCLCWIVAIVQLTGSHPGRSTLLPAAQTLPAVRFGYPLKDAGKLNTLLDNLQKTFVAFFVRNLDLPVSVTKSSKEDAGPVDENDFTRLGEVDMSTFSAPLSAEPALLKSSSGRKAGLSPEMASTSNGQTTHFGGERATPWKMDGCKSSSTGVMKNIDSRDMRILIPEQPQRRCHDPHDPLDAPPFEPAVIRKCIRTTVRIQGHDQPQEVLVLTSMSSTVENILSVDQRAARICDLDGEDVDECDISDFSDCSFTSSSEEESDDEEFGKKEEQRQSQNSYRLKAFWLSKQSLYEKHYGIFAAHIFSAKVLEKADSNWVTTDEEVAIKAVSWNCIRACQNNRLSEDFVKEIAALQYVREWHKGGSPGSQRRSFLDTHILTAETIMWNESHLYIAMPYCAEGDLCQRVSEQEGMRFTEDESRFWFKQVLLGLETLQMMQICHRDLSPENLIIMDNKSLVIDFGMCLRIPYSSAGMHLITPKAPCGKLPHMPPELFKRLPFDGHAVDIWAAGTILLFMLTGQRLHNPPLVDRAFDNIDLGISHEAMDLLRKMFRLDPMNRLSLEQIQNHPFIRC